MWLHEFGGPSNSNISDMRSAMGVLNLGGRGKATQETGPVLSLLRMHANAFTYEDISLVFWLAGILKLSNTTRNTRPLKNVLELTPITNDTGSL